MDTLIFKEEIMQIKLYKMQCEKNKINKTSYLTNEVVIEGSFVEGTSLIKPSIRIQIENFGYNYVIIPQFGRAYFVDNVIVERTMMFRVDLVVDVLYTYRTDILNQNAFLDRTSNASYNTKEIKDQYLLFSNEIVIDRLQSLNLSIFDNINYKDFSFRVEMIDSKQLSGANGDVVNKEWLNIPASPLSGINSFTTVYYMNLSQLAQISTYCLANSEFASRVISITAIPINAKSIGMVTKKKDIFFNEDIAMRDVYYISELENENGIKNLSGQFPFYYKSNGYEFYEFSPYKECYIFLPYYGLEKIPSEYIRNGITVEMLINFSTAKLLYCISYVDNDDKPYPLITVESNIGVDIPITATNLQEIRRTQESVGLNNFGRFIASAAVGVGGVLSGNPFLALAGLGGAIGSIFQGAAAVAAIPDPTATTRGQSSSSLNVFQPTTILLFSISRKQVNSMDDYNTIIGLPSGRKVKLSQLNDSDIVSIAELHLDIANSSITTGFYATSQELDEIISKLKTICII